MNSGIADVVPFVASEKNVDACVVSSLLENVYDDWNAKPAARRRRTSTMSALYQRLAVAALQFDRGKGGVLARCAGGDEERSVGQRHRQGEVDVAAAQQVFTAGSGVADSQRRVKSTARVAR